MDVDLGGQQLGNYRLIRRLGEGGFARVYLGEHIHLGTQAAIKVLHTRLTDDDKENFRSEARTIACLEHPHIVRIFDFGFEDGIPFLAMTYAPNGTLRQLHPKGTVVPLALVVSYVKEIADALQYAHSQRLIHRDIKPENLLLGRNREILLSDFGIALVIQSSHYQSTKDVAGTVAYMAPEQIEAHPRSASDQYSLAVIVYEWLSGERPFYGTWTEVAIKHSLTSPPSICEKVPMLSPEVENVIFKALAKKPEQRFASIQAFAIALEQAYQAEQRPPLFDTGFAETLPIQFLGESVLPSQPSYSPPLRISSSNMQFPMPVAQVAPSLQAPEVFGEDPFARWSAMPAKMEAQKSEMYTQSKKKASASSKRQSRRTPAKPDRRKIVALVATGGVVAVGALTFGMLLSRETSQTAGTSSMQKTKTALIPTQQTSPMASGNTTSNQQTSVQPQPTTESTQPPVQHTGTVIGNTTTLALNSAITFTNPADGSESLLIHLPDGRFVAAEGACTHEGVQVKYHPDTHTLICPLHQAEFDPANNFKVLQPPAPTPLKAVPIYVNTDGTITA